jgi:predicted DNA-binding WGR domain protein
MVSNRCRKTGMPLRRSTRIVAAAVAAPNSAPPQSPKKRPKLVANKNQPTTKKRKTGLKTAINPSTALLVGVVDLESNINGTISVLDNEPCDVMLVLVDPAKHMDKFFILQLIDGVDGSYAVYRRWGRTGTSGQALEQRFDKHDDAALCFEKKFNRKTGLEWENRTDPTIGKKYRFIQQNFTAKRGGFAGAKWQYWVDDGVDGKPNSWYDYSVEGSAQVERLFQEHALNARLTNRLVDSGVWTYDVNLIQMIQINVKQPNKTSRRIRRYPARQEMNNLVPQPIAATASNVAVISTNHTSPVKCSSAATVTPPSSPIKSSTTVTPAPASSSVAKIAIKKEDNKSPPVDIDIDLFYNSTLTSSFSVAKDDDDEWADIVLNQCNITDCNNNNKYYRLQLLEGLGAGNFYVWMKWGRVGEAPKASAKDLKGPFSTKDAAFKVFVKKFKDKTGNEWGPHADFVPKKKQYTRIQIDNDVNVKDELKTVNVKSEYVEYLPSTLDQKRRSLLNYCSQKT